MPEAAVRNNRNNLGHQKIMEKKHQDFCCSDTFCKTKKFKWKLKRKLKRRYVIL